MACSFPTHRRTIIALCSVGLYRDGIQDSPKLDHSSFQCNINGHSLPITIRSRTAQWRGVDSVLSKFSNSLSIRFLSFSLQRSPSTNSFIVFRSLSRSMLASRLLSSWSAECRRLLSPSLNFPSLFPTFPSHALKMFSNYPLDRISLYPAIISTLLGVLLSLWGLISTSSDGTQLSLLPI